MGSGEDGGDGDVGTDAQEGAGSTKRGRGKRPTRVTRKKVVAPSKTVAQPVEYEWKCPVGGCGRAHRSVATAGTWTQEMGRGAIQMYA